MSELHEGARVRYQHSRLARQIGQRINPWLIRRTAPRSYDLAQTLVVAGSPRSGTTWLSELLATLPGAAVLFEPLQAHEIPEAERLGFHRGTCMFPGQQHAERQQYLRAALSGQVLTPWTTSRASLRQILGRKFWIVKFVHANLLLGWLTSVFPVRSPALIVRHPCAVVASQMKLWHAHCWREREFEEFLAAWPQFAPQLDQLKSPLQWLAACWCIEQYVPLSQPFPRRLRVVSYERLVREGPDELGRLLADWNLPLPAAAVRRLHRASTTTQRDSHVLRDGDPLAGWRRTLQPRQITQILEVVSAFGLDFYSSALEPDYDRLYGPSPIRQRARYPRRIA